MNLPKKNVPENATSYAELIEVDRCFADAFLPAESLQLLDQAKRHIACAAGVDDDRVRLTIEFNVRAEI